MVFKDGDRAIAGVGSDVVWVRCGSPGRHYGAGERWTPGRPGVGEQGLLMQSPWRCRARRTTGGLPVLVPPAGGSKFGQLFGAPRSPELGSHKPTSDGQEGGSEAEGEPVMEPCMMSGVMATMVHKAGAKS